MLIFSLVSWRQNVVQGKEMKYESFYTMFVKPEIPVFYIGQFKHLAVTGMSQLV